MVLLRVFLSNKTNQLDKETTMFTIKFFYDEDNYNVVSAPHYNVFRNHKTGVVEVTIYKDFTTQSGITYRVSREDIDIPSWKYAFIENSSGKTIDHIK